MKQSPTHNPVRTLSSTSVRTCDVQINKVALHGQLCPIPSITTTNILFLFNIVGILYNLLFFCVFLFMQVVHLFQETNFLCDCFQLHCQVGSHIPYLWVDLVCAVFLCVLTLASLSRLGIFGVDTDINIRAPSTPKSLH